MSSTPDIVLMEAAGQCGPPQYAMAQRGHQPVETLPDPDGA